MTLLFGCCSGGSASRGAAAPSSIRTRLLEEQRQLCARRALECECASLRRQHSALARELERMRQEQERQTRRMDRLQDDLAACVRSEDVCLVEERQRTLLRRNAELECELELGRARYARLLEAHRKANTLGSGGEEDESGLRPSEDGAGCEWERL